MGTCCYLVFGSQLFRRSGKMMIRWMTAAVFEAAKGFRPLKGCKDLPALITALRRRDEQLGLTKPITAERVA